MAQVMHQVFYYFTEETIHGEINEVLCGFLLTQSTRFLIVQAMKDILLNNLSLEETSVKYNISYFKVYYAWQELEKRLAFAVAFAMEQRKSKLQNAASEEWSVIPSKIKDAIDRVLLNCSYESKKKKRLNNDICPVLMKKSALSDDGRFKNIPPSIAGCDFFQSSDLLEIQQTVEQHASSNALPSSNKYIDSDSSKSTELRNDGKYVAVKSVFNFVNENINEISDPATAEKILNERLDALNVAAKELIALYKNVLEKEPGKHNLKNFGKNIEENFKSVTLFLQHESEKFRSRFL